MKYIKISAMWCPYCIIMNKIWKKIKEEYPDTIFEELDLDMDEETEKYNVGETLPVVLRIENDKEVARLTGEKTYEEVKKFIEEGK